MWEATGEELQQEFLGFSAMRNLEVQQESSLTQEVLSFAKEVFQSLRLDYFLPNAPDNLHLHEADPSGFLTSCEGGRGSLELLHPCPECPSMTKFQTLFVPDPMFDKYRLAFLLNSANNPGTGGDEWLFGTLSFLADELDDQGRAQISTCLRRGVEIIRRRHACYGNFNLPLGCISERAWEIGKSYCNW